jgi:NADPH:quinone reductase-like Zn-dependent oxidoreductase
MRSARLHAFTSNPDDIRIEDVPVPQPGPGQVRVRMRYSPVNPSDLNFVRGTYYQALERVLWNQPAADGRRPIVSFDAAHAVPCPLPPYALGGEGMGVVEACGTGLLARSLRGKRVAIASGPPNGTWQECVCVEARKVVSLPDSLPDEQGAMYFVNPITAYVMVREVLRVTRGGWVLVTAAGSALGRNVVRMGRNAFRTICVVRSSANSAELRALGAVAVIETDKHDLVGEVARVTSGKGVGYALDCVGGAQTAQVMRCLAPGGHLVLYGTLADSPIEVAVRDLMMPVARVSGFLLPNWIAQQSPLKLLGVLRAVRTLAVDGVFQTEVTETFSLEDASQAVQAALRPGRTGKVMLRI